MTNGIVRGRGVHTNHRHFPDLQHTGTADPGYRKRAGKEVFLSQGGFKEALRASCEDWDLAVRVTRRYPATAIREPLFVVYEQLSSNSRQHLAMLQREFAIVDSTLLEGLSGWRRVLWRHRVIAAIYARAAIGAREAGAAGWPHLMKSFGHWPVPETLTGKLRLKTLAADVRDMIFPSLKTNS